MVTARDSLPIYIIGEPNSERTHLIDAQLNSLNISYELRPSVFPKTYEDVGFKPYLFRERYGREAKISEAGVLEAHKAILRSVNSEWAVILEDDAELEPSAAEFLSSVLPTLEEPTLVLLGHSRTIKKNLWFQRLKQPLANPISLGKKKFGNNPSITKCGTVGYMINRSAAQLWASSDNYYVIDDFDIPKNIGINVLHPFRPIVYERQGLSSLTGNAIFIQHAFLSRRWLYELSALFKVWLLQGKRNLLGVKPRKK